MNFSKNAIRSDGTPPSETKLFLSKNKCDHFFRNPTFFFLPRPAHPSRQSAYSLLVLQESFLEKTPAFVKRPAPKGDTIHASTRKTILHSRRYPPKETNTSKKIVNG